MYMCVRLWFCRLSLYLWYIPTYCSTIALPSLHHCILLLSLLHTYLYTVVLPLHYLQQHGLTLPSPTTLPTPNT
ncbi:hypothetical protein F5X96DRAFT_645381 [Biscogniauxia mediterranea]|nr:hypothetical protein F5X96DRAFT_645381 [Biscogniauxia mediterranea]